MINQQRWGINLNSDFMLLKFRLPWLNKYIDNDYLNFKNNLIDSNTVNEIFLK